MKTILLLTPVDSIKGRIVIHSMLTSDFFRNYELIFGFEKTKGVNIDLINGYRYIVVGKKIDKSKLPEYDILISCGWGWLISEKVINDAKIGAFNCHGSYLPDFKGSSAFFHYWANCMHFAGATIHYLTKKFDEGNIIFQEKVKIHIFDSYFDILRKQSEITAQMLPKAIQLVNEGFPGTIQEGGRYFFKLSPKRMRLYRLINCFFRIIGSNRRIYTPHKLI